MTLNASSSLFVGGTSTTTAPLLNRGVYLQSQTNNDIIGYSLLIDEGVNNRRGSFFLDDSTGVFGLDTSASTGVPSIVLRTAGTDRLRISGGNGAVGIACTPNNNWSGMGVLEMGDLGAGLGYFASDSASITETNIGHGAYYDGNWKYVGTSVSATRYRMTGANAGSTHEWFVSGGGTAGNAISFTQAMTLDASGNLGVGATSPLSKLDVSGGAASTAIRVRQTAAGGASEIRFGDDTDNDGAYIFKGGSSYAFFGGANTFAIWNNRNAPMVFGTNNAERGRFTAGGDFNLGVVSTNAGVLYIQTGTGGTTGRIIDAVNSAGNRYFEVQTDGDVYNTNGTYGTISDERLKQDIVDAGSQWDDLKAIRFRKYRMKTDVEANPDAPAMFGVVAQELAQVCPGLVDEHPNMKTVEVTDEEGNVTQTQEPDGTTTLTVKSSILLMKAAKALQEAMARIEQLEADMAALKASA
jgi:hypothetical protein